MQSEAEAWRGYFGHRRVRGWRGQERLWAYAADGFSDRALVVLPTGYGKTRAALGVYLILRALGVVDRCLWLVPNDALREQMAPTLEVLDPEYDRKREKGIEPSAQAVFGLSLSAVVQVKKTSADLKLSSRGRAEIFVATYQQVIRTSPADAVKELMEYPGETGRPCRWLIIGDEAHHLSAEGDWGPKVEALPAVRRLYLSATPLRTDRRRLLGVPETTAEDGGVIYKAAVEVTYPEARAEGAIRTPRGHIEHYWVDTMTGDGTPLRVSTEALRQDKVQDYPTYEARRGLRYCDDYLSSILVNALSCLNSKLLRHPGEHQMLVFAMSTKHAEAVAAHLNTIEEGCADHVHVERTLKERRDVLDRFEANKLKCLVQIAMAGEGFDNYRCSVLTFLSMTRSSTRGTQEIGRGLRRNFGLAPDADPLDVFASADTTYATLIEELEALCESYEEREERKRKESDEERELRLPSWWVVAASWERTQLIGPAAEPAPYPDWAIRGCEEQGLSIEKFMRVLGYQPGNNPAPPRGSPEMVEMTRAKFYHDQVNLAVSVMAGFVARRCGAVDEGVRKQWSGQAKHLIHTRWVEETGVATKAMISDDFKNKYDWLKVLEREINCNGIPGWLRLDGGSWPR